MKRSEREEELLFTLNDFWASCWAEMPDPRKALAAALVEAEIANGAKFEPEEEPLPERLDTTDRETGSDAWLGVSWIGHVGYDHRRLEREAKRRYNAWQQLRAGVNEALAVYGTRGEDYARLKKLLAILDGRS